MKNKLYVMCGCPGSGKSTFCKTHFENDVKYVSRDDIRFSLVKEDEEYFSHENEVFDKYISEIKDGLTYGDTIADATHLNSGSRTKLLRNLGNSLKDCEVIAVVVKTSLDTCINRNEKRIDTRSYVPISVIKNMYVSFSMPRFEEGFDKIIVVNSENNNKITVKVKNNE